MADLHTVHHPALFDAAPFYVAPPEPAQKVSPEVCRRQRQAEALAAGLHPLSTALGWPIRLHEQAAPADDRDAPGRRCGTCRFREVLGYHQRSYPKCLHPEGRGADDYERLGPPRVTHGAGTDVRRWWPACDLHEYGDPALSADAARWVPEAVTA